MDTPGSGVVSTLRLLTIDFSDRSKEKLWIMETGEGGIWKRGHAGSTKYSPRNVCVLVDTYRIVRASNLISFSQIQVVRTTAKHICELTSSTRTECDPWKFVFSSAACVLSDNLDWAVVSENDFSLSLHCYVMG